MNAFLSLRKLCAAVQSVVDRVLSLYLGEPLSMAAQGYSMQELEGRYCVDAPAILPFPGDTILWEPDQYHLWLDFVPWNGTTHVYVDWGDGNQTEMYEQGEHFNADHNYNFASSGYLVTLTAATWEPEFDGTTTYTFHVTTQNVTPYTSVSQLNSYEWGQPLYLGLSVSDPGNDSGEWRFSFDWGDNGEGGNNDTSWSFDYLTVGHTYTSTGEHNLHAYITDDGGTFPAYSATFDNVLPDPSVSGPSSISRTDPYPLSFMTGDPGDDTFWHVEWGDGQESWFYDNASSGSFSHQYGHSGSFSVNATCMDSGGSVAAPTASVDVVPVTPTISATGNASVNEGASYTLSLSAENAEDNANWSINWGDGSDVESVAVTSPSATHVFAGISSATINASLEEGNSSFAAEAVDVSVTRKFYITGGSAADEGSSYTLSLGHTSAVSGSITGWTIDWGDSSTPSTPSGSATYATHTYADDCWYGYEIQATATDGDGTFAAEAAAYVTVNQVAPTVSVSGSSSVNEGTYTLGLSATGCPPGHSIDKWEIAWGDGSDPQAISGNPTSATHLYDGDQPQYTISATAYDKDGGFEADPLTVDVANQSPQISLSGDSSVDEGSTYTLDVSTSDVGDDYDHVTIDWGDGAVQTFDDNTPPTHIYMAHSTSGYDITATAYDAAGGSSVAHQNVVVNDVPPTLHVDGPGTYDPFVSNPNYVLNLWATDPGDDGIVNWSVNWGDGGGYSAPISGDVAQASHFYWYNPAGYTISVRAYDNANPVSGYDAGTKSITPSWTENAFRVTAPGNGVMIQQSLRDPNSPYTTLDPFPYSSLSQLASATLSGSVVYTDLDNNPYSASFPGSSLFSVLPVANNVFTGKIHFQNPYISYDTREWTFTFAPQIVSVVAQRRGYDGNGTLLLGDPVVTEGEGGLQPGFYLTRSNTRIGEPALTVSLDYSGSNADFSAPSSATFPAYDAADPSACQHVFVPVTINDNSTPNWTRYAVARVVAAEGYAASPMPGQIDVLDNDISLTGPDGQTFFANTDDDNHDGVEDLSEHPVSGDNDLYEVDLNLPAEQRYGAKVTLTANTDVIAVWDSASKSHQILGPLAGSSKTWTLGFGQTVPTTFFMEFIGGSVSLLDGAVSMQARDGVPTTQPRPTTNPTTMNAQLSNTAVKVDFHGPNDVAPDPEQVGGYDIAKNGKWLMVPTGKTNELTAFITPANLANSIQFVSTVPAEAVVSATSNPAPIGNTAGRRVQVTGIKKGQSAVIQAQMAGQNGGPPLDVVKVDVKDPKDITVAVFDAADARHGPQGNQIPFPDPPTMAQVQAFLTKVFTRQAAINVTVQNMRVEHQLNWDADLNGAVDAPNSMRGPQEYRDLVNSRQIAGVQADYKIIFVNRIMPGGKDPEGQGLWWSVPGNVVLVATRDEKKGPFGAGQTTFFAAHELGHALGLDHNPARNHLMTASTADNPNLLWELDKSEWDIINP